MIKRVSYAAGWVITLSLMACSSAVAQERPRTPHRMQTWVAYFSQMRFSDRSGLWLDLHYRVNDDVRAVTSISRLAYTYYFKDQLRLSAGYAYVRHFSQSLPDISEQRLWQQLQWIKSASNYNLSQWFRIEERFRQRLDGAELTDDYNFNWRFRYNIAWTIPLSEKTLGPKHPFLILNDEVHVNAGKRTQGQRFDQNRLFLGVGYRFAQNMNAHLGYLYVYQQVAPSSFVNISAIRFYATANFDFRRRD